MKTWQNCILLKFIGIYLMFMKIIEAGNITGIIAEDIVFICFMNVKKVFNQTHLKG